MTEDPNCKFLRHSVVVPKGPVAGCLMDGVNEFQRCTSGVI